jgi:hypothetical protein
MTKKDVLIQEFDDPLANRRRLAHLAFERSRGGVETRSRAASSKLHLLITMEWVNPPIRLHQFQS